MNAPMKQSQADILTRLYNLKQQQLLRAAQQVGSLRYQVLEAEAKAISDALNAIR